MSPDADQASSIAVQAGSEAFNEGFAKPAFEPHALLRSAIASAVRSVTELGRKNSESPSTTLVAAVVSDHRLTVGWLGDSRAYWIVGDGIHQVTRDHSWLNSPAGQQAGADAQKSANAHALTRWVGADAEADDLEPEIVQQDLKGGGLLLLCSDGLWNYAQDCQEMSALVASFNTPGASALAVSRALVEFARSKGGHDNITAAVLRYPVPEDQHHGG